MEILKQELKVGYNPMMIRDAWGYQLLLQIWLDDDGELSVSIARREESWHTWSPPLDAHHV